MSTLRKYWFKPEYQQVRLIRRIKDKWDKDNGGDICPVWFLKRYPGSFLMSRNDLADNGWVRVAFHNPELPREFNFREYWVHPATLVEIP
jgi:hypothetical protein